MPRDYTLRIMSKHQTLAQRQKACDEWNDRYPIGTDVKVYQIAYQEDSTFEAKTRSIAQLSHGGGVPCVWLEGVPYIVALALVKPTI